MGSYQIIGVMPKGMRFPFLSDIWLMPLPPTERSQDRSARDLDVFGRLRNGVSLNAAESELRGIAQHLEKSYPETNKNIDLHVRPFASQFESQRNRNSMWALMTAVCFVLLIICSNLANLLVARGVHRSRETAIRIAIGATRWQVIRFSSGRNFDPEFGRWNVGSGFASVAVHLLSNIADNIRLSARLPFCAALSTDYQVFLYLIGISVITGVLFWNLARG